ncbi:MAG TPA: class I SAM-dependent methyltransferase [Bacteroidetes bacterium]|nr:class I SAM-dependent methyltransferase [Bacteroidota bacterium]
MPTPDIYYAPDLAQVHHEAFGNIAKAAAQTILKETSLAYPSPVSILDLGCGSGITAAHLSQAGHHVTGIDYSAAMIRIARQHAPLAHFQQASLFDYEFPPVQVITAISEAFNYLFDEQSSLNMLHSLFQRIHAALPPGGLFIFDVLTTDVIDYQKPRKAILENEKWSMFFHIQVDCNTDQLTREITLFTKEGDRYRRSYETHRQQLYRSPDIQNLLHKVGFSFTPMSRYGNQDLRQGLQAFSCKKAI